MNTNISNNTNIFCVHKRLDIRKIRLIRDIRVHKKNPVFLQSLPAQAWNIRVIRVIRVHKKNPVFTRRISCPPVLSRASVEHSCYSRYSCSKEESRVHKKNLVSSSPFPRKRGTFVLFELFVFKRRISCSQEKSRVPPIPSRASVENSCYSSYSCSKEKSRVHKKFIRVPIRMQK